MSLDHWRGVARLCNLHGLHRPKPTYLQRPEIDSEQVPDTLAALSFRLSPLASMITLSSAGQRSRYSTKADGDVHAAGSPVPACVIHDPRPRHTGDPSTPTISSFSPWICVLVWIRAGRRPFSAFGATGLAGHGRVARPFKGGFAIRCEPKGKVDVRPKPAHPPPRRGGVSRVASFAPRSSIFPTACAAWRTTDRRKPSTDRASRSTQHPSHSNGYRNGSNRSTVPKPWRDHLAAFLLRPAGRKPNAPG